MRIIRAIAFICMYLVHLVLYSFKIMSFEQILLTMLGIGLFFIIATLEEAESK